MSRLSRANLKARESVFAGGPELYRGDIQAICPPNLIGAVAALEDACEELGEAQGFLRGGTEDFPRMAKVLESQRVFMLIDESTVKRYKTDAIEKAEPAIYDLIQKAEQGLKQLRKKESQLQAKVDDLQSRPSGKPGVASTLAQQKIEQRRVTLLTTQRERLEAELKELEAEVNELESR